MGTHRETSLGMPSRQDFSPRSHRDTEKTSRSGSSDRFERSRLPVVLRYHRYGDAQRNKPRNALTARFFTTEPQRHGENLKKWLVGQVRAFSSPRSFEISQVWGRTEKQASECPHGKIFHHGATETRRKPQEVARRTGSSVLVSP